jgi:hypothetical protein
MNTASACPRSEPLQVPPLWCPIPAARHPQAGIVTDQMNVWLEASDMYWSDAQRRRLLRVDVGDLTGRVLSRAPEERLLAVSYYFAWLFAFDDGHYDEVESCEPAQQAEIVSRLLRIVETPNGHKLARSPYERSLAEVAQRLSDISSPHQFDRWIQALRAYLFCLVWKTANRAARIVPALNDYTTMRIDGGAVRSTIMLIDIGAGYVLPDRVFHLPAVRALIEMTSTMVCWDNDLQSHHKEAVGTADRLNLIDVLMNEHGYGPDKALSEAVAMRDRVLRLFLHLRERVAANADDTLLRYLDSLASWIRANLDWGNLTDRYLRPSRPSVPPACLPEHVSDRPTGNLRPDPLPISSIAWWWTV